MDILIAIFTFAMIGGIARASILVIQAWKSGSRFSLKQVEVTDIHKLTCKRVSMVLQGLWLFIVLVIVSGMHDWVSGAAAFVAFVALSAPVLILQGGNWVLQDGRWPFLMLFIGIGIQVGAMGAIEDYFYDHDDFIWSAIAAVSCFLGLYVVQNGIAFWNLFALFTQSLSENFQQEPKKWLFLIVFAFCGVFFYVLYQHSLPSPPQLTVEQVDKFIENGGLLD